MEARSAKNGKVYVRFVISPFMSRLGSLSGVLSKISLKIFSFSAWFNVFYVLLGLVMVKFLASSVWRQIHRTKLSTPQCTQHQMDYNNIHEVLLP